MAGPPVIIAYVPVLHEGYIAFFKRYQAARVFVLSRELTGKYRPLAKDLRALDPKLVCKALATWGVRAEPAGQAQFKSIAKFGFRIIMPDEDISHSLAEEYFDGSEIEYAKIFLRWDKRASDAKEAVEGAKVVAPDQAMVELMRRANAVGERSTDIWRRLGALIVHNGKVLLESYNRALPEDGTPWADGDPRSNYQQGDHIETSIFMHAEAGLVAEAAAKGISLAGTDLFITTFPCPICAKLLVTAGIKRVYFVTGYAMLDAERLLRQADVEIIQVKVDLPDNHPELWVPYPD